MTLFPRHIERSTGIAAACAVGLCLLAPLSRAQSTVCAKVGDDVENCVASVLRIPAQTRADCERRNESERAARAQEDTDQHDEAAARARLAEARMDDAELAVPRRHTNLEENFDAARSRVSADKALDAQAPPTSSSCSDAAPDSRQETIEIRFDAPIHCLQALQRSVDGALPIAVEIVGQEHSRPGVARLLGVASVVDGDSSIARARATLDGSQSLVLDDDTVVVQLHCR